MVCIIDDREDVWSYASNLIHVKPYHFFQHTGDINAPPGLDKHEDDEKTGVDLTNVKSKQKLLKINGSSLDPALKLSEDVKNESKINEQEDTNEKKNNSEGCEDQKEEEEIVDNEAKGIDSGQEKIDESPGKEKISEDSKNINCTNLEEDNKENMRNKDQNELENKETTSKEDNKHETNKEQKNSDNVEKSEKIQREEKKENEDNDRLEKSEIIQEEGRKVKEDNDGLETSKNIQKEEKKENENDDELEKSENIQKEEKKVNEDDDKLETSGNINKEEVDESKANEMEKNIELINEEKKTENIPKEETKVIDENNENEVDKNEAKQEKCINEKENADENEINRIQRKEDELIEVEDPDDYLMYLEEILRIIHKAFYEKYDKMECNEVPDLKKVIPEVRSNILKGTRLVFSGLVPTHIKLEQSRAYQVARSLGAIVTQDLEADTTHLVAVRPGTAKVNVGRRKKNLKIVTPDWLWSCAERWEHVEEKLYPLSNKGSKNRHPPPHCSSPEHIPNFDIVEPGIIRKRTPSGRFMDTINPLMSFSSADIADMDREVEDIFNESESESETSNKRPANDTDNDDFVTKKFKTSKETDDESSSSDESLTGEHPHGWNPKSNKQKRSREDQEQEIEDESTADEYPSTKFRRGEELSSDLEFGQDSNSEGSVDAPDEIDDGDWNMMGAALEREFLSNN